MRLSVTLALIGGWLLASGCHLWQVRESGGLAFQDPAFQRQVEADWRLQEQQRYSDAAKQGQGRITTMADAAGAVDGVKNGGWAFHTLNEKQPWWQVDLGEPQAVARLEIWNRADTAAPRTSRLILLLSDDGKTWRQVYQHDGTVFYGFTDKQPLVVKLDKERGRLLRIQLPGASYFHLDEVEVYGPGDPKKNLALHRPADQSSTSQWSSDSLAAAKQSEQINWKEKIARALAECAKLVEERKFDGANVSAYERELRTLQNQAKKGGADEAYFHKARWLQRELTLAHPLLDFDALLVTKRVPGSYSHMSDQYMGWWSRPGGGIYILRNFKSGAPTIECLTDSFTKPGSFLRPMLSYDGRKIIFAWCKHYPNLAAEKNKLDKGNCPEDSFYHLFEMNADGAGVRQLTRGKYDDFDARYLPDGKIVFLSTRRGQFLQVNRATARRSLETPDLPNVYVRCGGGPQRPCKVYTLHTMKADGSDLNPISPFEMFEWTPTVAHDGSLLYSRWDYIDRSNQPYMSLWSTNTDGTNAKLVYGNFTHHPNCTFEPRSVPGSQKIVFTGSAHHSQTIGSLVLLDPAAGSEGEGPMRRLTPEVVFPEIEGWPATFFANPWPLSERAHLVAWGKEDQVREGRQRPVNGMGIYFFEAARKAGEIGRLELLHRDPEITSAYPIPLRARPKPHVRPDTIERDAPEEGRFMLVDVYRGLTDVPRGAVKALRVVAVPPKTHPTMNFPAIGVTRDDPGKCVLGTVPVEADGSAYFRVPSGVIVFFQALDERGMAIQTMRSTSHVQPGQTLSCIGCHESRHEAPAAKTTIAMRRAPSKLAPGPDGCWPMRYDRLVQPVLDRHCVSCHAPGSDNAEAAKFALTAAKSYDALIKYGKPSLHDRVMEKYRAGKSTVGDCLAATSPLLETLTAPKGHHKVQLNADELRRLIIWMDTYAQKAGSFDDAQEQQLLELKARSAPLLLSHK